MAFRHVIADDGGKLRRGFGKSKFTQEVVEIPSPSVQKIRRGFGKTQVTGGGTVDWTDFVAQDPYYQNVVLYLPCEGANNSTEIYDYAYNTIVNPSLNGSPIITTSFKKYGQSSLYLNGSSWLTFPNTSKWQFGTGNFTIEFWCYGLSASASSTSYCAAIYAMPSVGATTAGWGASVVPSSTSQIFFNASTGGGTWNVFSGVSGSLTPTLSNNSWAHCAYVRSGNNMLFFHNGILKNTVAFTANTMPNPPEALNIGVATNGTNFPLIGYLDSIRITKGVARYTADFDPENDTYLSY